MGRKLVLVLLAATTFVWLAVPTWAAAVPEDAQRHFDRGMAAVEMAKSPEDYDLAIAEFQKAIALAPDWSDVYYNLGLVQERAGKYRDAAGSLRKFLQLAPNSPDATAIRTLANKAEFKAEQVLTDEDVLDIVVSLTDKSRWQMKGVTNANLFNGNIGWVRSFSRNLAPGNQNRLFFEFYSGTCCPTLKGMCPGNVLPVGRSVEFTTFYCAGQDASMLSAYNFRLEVVSRNQVKMFLRYHGARELGGRKEDASYEFLRR